MIKNEARDELDISLNTIYDRNHKKCLEEARAQVEVDISILVLSDIVSCFGGGLL